MIVLKNIKREGNIIVFDYTEHDDDNYIGHVVFDCEKNGPVDGEYKDSGYLLGKAIQGIRYYLKDKLERDTYIHCWY